MQDTVVEYNEQIESGVPDPLGKKDQYRVRIDYGPYYGLNVSLRRKLAPLLMFSLGGIVG